MTDPLSEVISILRPHAPFSKLVHAVSPFHIRRDSVDKVFYCMLLTGKASLNVDGKQPLTLGSGDFVLIPALNAFSFSSVDPSPPDSLFSYPILGEDGVYRLGASIAPPDVQVIVGHCSFASSDADLRISFLPDMVIVNDEERLATLASLLRDEVRSDRPAKNVVVEHLLQVLLIEAFRSTADPSSSSGLLRGLADSRIAPTVRAIHHSPSFNWTISELAKTAKLSRSAYFARFNKIVGIAPMGYLLNWRMTIAKHMLRAGNHGMSEIAERIGYGSASAFSSAFTRHVGLSPSGYSKTKFAEI